mmetsp:Transcript_14360/g.59954  ORF Transcript_14360/g.59954 Transcript_14360/m.59954 type:complete len:224 (+) Transcript_14360:123-794(+)
MRPDLRPWTRTRPSEPALKTCELSRLNMTLLVLPACAAVNMRRSWPVRTRQTLMTPSNEPDASSSESRLNATHSTESSCIINASSAWNCRSVRIFPVATSSTSMKPSLVPATKKAPSADTATHSECDFLLPTRVRRAGATHGRSPRAAAAPPPSPLAALPASRSKRPPASGTWPMFCCHFSACPKSARRRPGGTSAASFPSSAATASRRDSRPPAPYASLASK